MTRLKPLMRIYPLACVLAATSAARGDVTWSEEKDENGFVVTDVAHMAVTPAAEPRPAFKHRLVIPDIDTSPGNAVPYYYRAMLELPEITHRFRRKYGEDYDNWPGTAGADAIPLNKLPLDKLRDVEQGAWDGYISEQLAEATSRRNCDWDLNIYDMRGPDLIAFVLNEFNESRGLSRLLALRTRLAVAEHRYDDAIDAMRMNYRLGVDSSRLPLLVCGLVGCAQAGIANGTLLELIAAPDSPNMYWALTELPQPFVDLRPAARFEMEFGLRMFPFIHNAETTDRSPQEWNRLYTQAVRDLSTVGGGTGLFAVAKKEVEAGLAATELAFAGYPHAKARLIQQGLDRQRVENMSVGQVIAIYTERLYQRFADDQEKLWYLPYWEMRRRGGAVEVALREARVFGPSPDREVLPIVSLLLPAMQAARAAQVRLERDIAALRVIEALRIYAAANNGRLPESLDAVTQVPIPLNPATGKPFAYHLDGQTAILELPKSDGLAVARRYEIQIAETKK